jgi:hypothetical protein
MNIRTYKDLRALTRSEGLCRIEISIIRLPLDADFLCVYYDLISVHFVLEADLFNSHTS